MASLAAIRYGLVGLGVALLGTLQLQLLQADRLQRDRLAQMGGDVLFQLRLGELALDRLPPKTLARLSGLPLRVGATVPSGADSTLRAEATLLRRQLCQSLDPCPRVLPLGGEQRGVWVELLAPLEPVWLWVPIPPVRPWPPDPWLLLVGAGLGGGMALLFYLWLEVQRPLRRLRLALAGVGGGRLPEAPLLQQGTTAVRQLTDRFNAMVRQLEGAEQERGVMLAGIAHDLKSPITRLRFRLSLAGLSGGDLQKAEADLAALERITGQFLLFAGGADYEASLALPLDQLLAEQTSHFDRDAVVLALEPLVRTVQPVALARAVANLLDNSLQYGGLPLRLELHAADPAGEGFRIVIWDGGPGIAASQWEQALMPFQRLDPSRGGSGHSGLGMAIAARVARNHGGCLQRLTGDGECGRRFGIALSGRSRSQPGA